MKDEEKKDTNERQPNKRRRYDNKRNKNCDGDQNKKRDAYDGGRESNPKGCKQDPFWYAKDEQAIRNMASFPFLEVVGNSIGQYTSDKIPGVMVISWVPAFNNNTGTPVDYITKAANAYFQYVTQGFTGSVDFEAPDLLMTALAAESLAAVLIEGKRVYAATKYYLQFNATYAEMLVRALGFDYEDMVQGLADFRTQLNLYIEQFNKIIAVPKSFFVGDRWEFLSGAVFTDTSSPEYSTAIVYRCNTPFKYSGTTAKTGTCLEWRGGAVVTTTNYTRAAYFNLLDELLTALTSDDARAMFGAIRRVYSPDQLKIATPLNDDIVLPILKHDIMSAAIHNASWCVYPTDDSANVIGYLSAINATDSKEHLNVPLYQNASGKIISSVYGYDSTGGTGFQCISQPISMYDHLVSPANVLDITANVACASVYGTSVTPKDSTNVYYPLACRSEAITSVRLYTFDGSGNPKATILPKYQMTFNGASSSLEALYQWSKIDSAPILVIGSSTNINGYLGEFDKYTVLSRHEISNLQNSTLFQLLSMPTNTKSVTR